MTYHYLPVFDISEACALLRGTPAQYRRFKYLTPFAFRNACGGAARWVAPGYDGEVLEKLGPDVCRACLDGRPCDAWKACDLSEFQPRAIADTDRPETFHHEPAAPRGMTVAKALKLLGIKADAGPAETKRAVNAAILAAHPDHGGSREALTQVLAARATLATR